MNTSMKVNGIVEMNLNNMEQTGGGWLITVGAILACGVVVSTLPYIMDVAES